MSVYAFIDSQNLNLGVKSQGWQLDFGKFRQYLITKYQVKKTFLFIGYVQGNQSLYTYLQSVSYICIFKPTLQLSNDKGDFYCLIEYLEKKNKLLKIIAPNQKYSSLLRKYATFIAVIAPMKDKLQIKKRGIPAGNKVRLW